MAPSPRITIAIPTRNRRELLAQTLTALRSLTPSRSPFEVLVVDNGSTDGTLAMLEEVRASGVLPLRVDVEPTPGSSNVRNRAIEVAQGEYILFTDDDVRVDRGWLVAFETAVERHPSAAGWGGVIEPWFAEPPDPDLADAFPELATGFCGLDFGPEERPLKDGQDMYAANLGFRRDIVAGFRFNPRLGVSPAHNLGYEESDLQRRLRQASHTLVWVPTMRVAHYVPAERMTTQYLVRFVRDRSRAWAWFGGREASTEASRTALGAPTWLWKQCGEAWLEYWGKRVVRDRRGAARSLARYAKLRGWIDGCRSRPPGEYAG